jgi:iron complex outermembrane receptor protein
VKKFGKGSLLRSTVLAGFAATAFAATPALAQEADEDEQEEEQASQGGDRIVVTGSRLRRNEFTSASPIQVVNAEVATLEGLVDTAELIQTTSVAAGSFQLNNQFGGFVVEGGTGINSISLRGLGAQRSLVLLNGRRPGPAGTRGQVGSFDLNVIPTVIVQRVEILKDGAGSVYGSDAVAGVVNVITLTSVDEPIISVQVNAPFEGGGETAEISGAYGFNFDRGNIVLAAEYEVREDLSVGDRDYLSCSRDLFTDRQGNNIDREDRSVLAGTDLAGCNNLYHNTIIDFGGIRYVPSPDGVTSGPFPGFRPRANGNYGPGGTGQAFYEDVLNFAGYGSADAINRTERASFYAQSNFTIFNGIDWNTEILVNNRVTESEGWRQFFPVVFSPSPSGLAQPVMPYPSNGRSEVDYYSLASGLEGGFSPNLGMFADWSWSLDAVYSRSEGTYGGNAIIASRSGDVRFDTDPTDDLNYFDPGFLNGDKMDELVAAIGAQIEGVTIYDQTTVTGFVTGELFDLPAGPVGLVLGGEYRTFSIEDTPDQASRNGDLWGSSSALVTEGDDSVTEFFGELEVPILAGQPFFEELTLSASGRVFEYDTAGSGEVYKLGLNWQVNPILRFRATQGTSFRAPALYELFLGNQTAFVGQSAIDPCIDWGQSLNDNIRTNCASLGIPATFTGGASSATVVTGGGAGVLEPETSDALSFGVILTPTDLNLSIALDYFSIEVNDQIGQLGGNAILFSCYNGDNFPNVFCNLFDRNPDTGGNDRFAITEVRDSYLNIDSQITEGLDISLRYDHEFDFGSLTFEGQGTWTFEDVVNIFDPSLETGFDVTDFNGTIGDPDFVANARLAFERGDWTASWFTDFVSRVSEAAFVASETTYFGFPDAQRDIDAEPVFYHDASLRYRQPTWSVLVGVQNIFDETPPTVSTGTATRRGNTPAFGTQYDLRGRTGFLRVTKTF